MTILDRDAELAAWYRHRENVTYTDGTPVAEGDRIRYHQAPGGIFAPGAWRYGVAVKVPTRYAGVSELVLEADGRHYNLFSHVIERAA